MSRWPRYGRDVKTHFGGLTRSELMTRIRSGGNKSTELKLATLLRQHRLNGWRRHTNVTGKPDFVWRVHRTAVFVDGCFWHGHDCKRNLSPKRNIAAWRLKIAQTKRRDRRVTAELKREGWLVVRIWECSLANNPLAWLKVIEAATRRRPARR